jgi:hypothetical protein
MMTLIAAALAAAAPAAQAQNADAHAQHGKHQHGQSTDHKAMGCCDHHKAGHAMDCCKDMADAKKAKACCADHAKAGHSEHKHN